MYATFVTIHGYKCHEYEVLNSLDFSRSLLYLVLQNLIQQVHLCLFFIKALCAPQRGINCYDFLTALTGKNCCLNASTVDDFLKNEPQSTSTKNFVHLAQTVRDGILRKYDWEHQQQFGTLW